MELQETATRVPKYIHRTVFLVTICYTLDFTTKHFHAVANPELCT